MGRLEHSDVVRMRGALSTQRSLTKSANQLYPLYKSDKIGATVTVFSYRMAKDKD